MHDLLNESNGRRTCVRVIRVPALAEEILETCVLNYLESKNVATLNGDKKKFMVYIGRCTKNLGFESPGSYRCW